MTGEARFLVASMIALALTACGGGGGGGGSGASPPPSSGNPPPTTPPPITPPPALPPADIGPQTYITAVEAGGRLIDFSLSFGISAAGVVSAQEGSGGAPITEACEVAGNFRLELVDNDRSGGVSAGDRVTVRYENCEEDGVTMNAVMYTDIRSMSVVGGEYRYSLRLSIASFTISAGAQTATASGSLDCEWTAASTRDRFAISGARVSITDQYGLWALENFAHDLTQDYAAYEYRLTTSGVAQTEYAGVFTFATDTPLIGRLGSYPQAGALTFRNSSNAAVRLEEGVNGETLGTEVGISQDFDGDGRFTAAQVSLSWGSMFDAGFFDSVRSGVTAPENPPNMHTLTGREVTLLSSNDDLGDLAVDARRNQLYVTAPFSNEVIVVSTSTYQPTNRIGIGARPAGVHLPDEGSTLYVALSRGGGLGTLNVETNAVGRIATAVVNNSSQAERVVGAAGSLFVSAFWSTIASERQDSYYARVDLANGNATSRISESVLAEPRSPMIASRDGRYLYTTAQIGNDTRLYKLDVSQPNAAIAASRDFALVGLANALTLSPDGALLVRANGEVLRTSDLSTIGEVQAHDAAAFSADGAQLLVMRGSSLILYDASRLITLYTYHPTCQPIGSSMSKQLAHAPASGEWILKYWNRICAVSLTNRLNAPGQAASPPPAPPSVIPLNVAVQGVFTPPQQGGSSILAAEIDRAAGRIYLGGMLDGAAEVAVVALDDLSIDARIPLPTNIQPRGFALDAAAQRLYVNQDGANFEIQTLDTNTLTLAAPLTYPTDLFGADAYGLDDVEPIGGGRLLLTARSNFSDPMPIGLLNAGAGTAVRIAAGVAKFFPAAQIVVAPDRSSAFVHSGAYNAGRRIQKLDLTAADPDVVYSRSSDELDGTAYVGFGPAGDRLHFSGGGVVDPQSLTLMGVTREGIQVPTSDGARIYVMQGFGERTLTVFDAATFRLLAVYGIDGCGHGAPTFAALGRNDLEVIWVQADRVCRVAVPQ